MSNINNQDEKEMVALFADFRGFSHMFDVLPAQKVYKFTNRYYQTASDIIERYKGTFDNIVGDGFIAIWGKDTTHTKAPYYAVRSALEMRMALLRQNIQYKWEAHFPLEIGVGVAMGKALHCIVGPKRHPIDTAIGKPVILASRLGDIAKNNQIYVDEKVAHAVTKWGKIQKLPKTNIRGFKGTFPLYKVEGLMDFYLKNGERRNSTFTRFVAPEIVAMVLKESGIRKPALLRNLSASGAGIELVQKDDTPIEKDAEITLDLRRFDFPSFRSLDGRIVRVNTISEESTEERMLSRVGIEFHDLDPAKRRYLEKFNIA
ncbi:MAG: PilZ domain-containing protein [Spirochaetota bacterium]|nr:MAG: PilZ domain-containing protein [Spirochaetota bacterium]